MTEISNVLSEFIERYGPPAQGDGPPLFVREVFGAEPDQFQEDVLRDYGSGERRISLRSCHNVGKTTVLAWCIAHQLVTRFPQKTAVTAPTKGQLYDALFSELKTWMKRMPAAILDLFEIKTDRVFLKSAPEESFATFRTARSEQPEALQGIHAPWTLLIVDEGSGVHEKIYEAGSGSMAGHTATTILAGNPVRSAGFFFNTHHKLKDMWKTYHICAGAAVPPDERRSGVIYSERVAPDFVEDIGRRYGFESNAFRVRVLGEFPEADLDAIIAFELTEAAKHRDVSASPKARAVWGLDVARFGDDLTALCKRTSNVVSEPIRTWRQLDMMQVVGVVKAEFDALHPSERPTEILVDVIGMGAGVVDRMRELKMPVRGINVAESPAMGDHYTNLRTELWFKAKEWFVRRDCKIPEDEDFQEELTQTKYEIADSKGKVRAESKKAQKKRGLRSPDRADSFILTFASHAATAIHGGYKRWDEPLKRDVLGVV